MFFLEDSLNIYLSIEFGQKTFFMGIFLLASAPSISAIFLFTSILISFFKNKVFFNSGKINILLILTTFFLVVSSIFHFLNQSGSYLPNWDPKFSIIGLANWVPYFFCFSHFQSYLNSERLRISSAILLLSGSIPVLISGFGQMFFNLYGPLEFLNGLIIWYQKEYPEEKVFSGLFSNPNYAASWLMIILPFSIVFLLKSKGKLSRVSSIIFLFSIIISIILTNSRSGILGIIFSTIFLLNNALAIIFIISIIIFSFILFISFKVNYQYGLIDYFYSLIPPDISKDFFIFNFFNIDQFPRFSIWENSLIFIKDNPIFGYGALNFKELYKSKIGDFGYYHSHNIFLDLSIGYGILPSILLMIFFLYFIRKSLIKIHNKKVISKNNKIFDKAWLVSFIWLLFSQLIDIQYYDFRIGCTFWILLAGLKCFVDLKMRILKI